MDPLYFSLPEVFALLGVTQCVYLLVYMLLRAGCISRAGLPIAYFLIMAMAFSFDLAAGRLGNHFDYYFYLQWAAWFLGPPISVLLVIQIAQIYKTPALSYYWVLLLLPAAFGISLAAVQNTAGCERALPCAEMQQWLVLTGSIAGCISLLTIWANREIFTPIVSQKTGKDRYWLVCALILINVLFLSAMLISLGAGITHDKLLLLRTILGLGFVYLAGTSLFRIYPQAVMINYGEKNETLSLEEIEIAKKVEKLLTLDKVYHESDYARTDLARECGASESVLSKVINVYFKKSFPQIINEYRVEDAKRLLGQTDANIKTVAHEVGFSSLASFNRVFRDIAGETPSEYRKKIRT